MSLPWKVTIAFLGSVNKQAFKNLKKKPAKNVNNSQKPKRMFLEVKMQEDPRRWWYYTLNLIKTAEIIYFPANKQETRFRVSYLEVSK